MAVKTFTTGEVLTASDTNTYLNNGGLVYITQVNLTGSAVTIQSCFSATFDCYRFVFSQVQTNVAGVLLYGQLCNGATPVTTATYSSTRFGYNGTLLTDNLTGQTQFRVGTYDDGKSGGTLEIYNPYNAVKTTAFAQSIYNAGGAYAYPDFISNLNTNATSYDGIKISVNGGSFSNGTLRIYGYRQA